MKLPILLTALLILACLQPENGRAQANDDFVNAVVFSGTFGQHSGTTVGSTNEPGEPQQGFLDGGVWYEWTSPNQTGIVSISLEIFETGFNVSHRVHAFQDVTGSIYDVIGLGYFSVSGSTSPIKTDTLAASPNTTYYFRVARDYNPSAFEFTLNFSPIYRTGVQFLTRSGTLRGPTKVVKAKLASPVDATRVRVFSSGKGRPGRVAYNGRTGIVTFLHHRIGGRPVGNRALRRANVTYTVVAYHNGSESGRRSKRFLVR